MAKATLTPNVTSIAPFAQVALVGANLPPSAELRVVIEDPSGSPDELIIRTDKKGSFESELRPVGAAGVYNATVYHRDGDEEKKVASDDFIVT